MYEFIRSKLGQSRCGRGYATATVAGGVRNGHATATVAVATPPPTWPRRGATVVANPQWPCGAVAAAVAVATPRHFGKAKVAWRSHRHSRHSATRQCVLATVAPVAVA